MEYIKLAEAAEMLGIGHSTVRDWCEALDLANVRDSKGRRLLSPDELQILQAAYALREQGSGLVTIQRKMGRERPASEQGADREGAVSREARELEEETASDEHTAMIVAQVVEAVREDRSLTLALVEASRLNGKLEAENEFLKQQLAESQTKLAAQETKILALEAPKHPWWRFWQ